MVELTTEERAAIRTLKRLAAKWPRGLWLFSNGRLHVMRRGADGQQKYCRHGGVDPTYQVCSIDLPSEGGDW